MCDVTASSTPTPRARKQRPAESPRGHRHTEESGHVPSSPRACRAEGLLVRGRKTPLHLLRPAGGLKTKRAAATLTGDAFRSDRHWYLFVREAFAEQQREPRGAATTCARPNPVAPQGNPHPPTRTRNQRRGARGAVFPVCDCFMQLPSEAPFLCLGRREAIPKGTALALHPRGPGGQVGSPPAGQRRPSASLPSGPSAPAGGVDGGDRTTASPRCPLEAQGRRGDAVGTLPCR